MNVSTGEPASCDDPGAVTQSVYDMHNDGDSASSGSSAEDSGGGGGWIIVLVVVAGAAVVGLLVVRNQRQTAAAAAGPATGSQPEGKGQVAADNDENPSTKKPGGGAASGGGSTNGLWQRLASNPALLAASAFVVGLLLAGGIGLAVVSSKNSDIDQLQADLSSQETATQIAEDERDAAEARADAITGRRDQIIASARKKGQGLIDDAKQELSGLEDKISDAQSDLSSTQSKLEQVQGSLAAAQETKQKSSFGDGIWQADADFIPGLYRAPGGNGCYWAKLNTADTSDIADNGFGGKNPTITIDSPFFETDGCGTWEKIG